MNVTLKRITSVTMALCASTVAQAQWISFNNQTGSRIPAGALTTTCPEEKDYSWGDFDHDGDTDVVVMRKRPLSCTGGRANLLLMNEGGVLVDRTSTHANTAIDVPGAQGVSQGFLDPTNDRQAVLIDLNNDGWLDIVTNTTMSEGQQKYIGYPRVYMNMGEVGGVWQGFRYEYNRIAFAASVPATAMPRFCGVAAGDLNNDGYADLFFVDYDGPENCYCSNATGQPGETFDFNNRVLMNQGAANPGYFTDDTAGRLGAAANIAFGAHALIADWNNDGNKDLMRINTLTGTQTVAIHYNNSGTGSGFTTSTVYTGAPYGVSTADMNNDGDLDLIISDDATDRFLTNNGNGTFVNSTIPGSIVEFTGQNSFSDLDNDGRPDALFPDQDIDTNFPNGGGRRMHIYRNINGTTFSEDNVTPILPVSTKAVYNVATFDINGDGWRDIIIGKGGPNGGAASHSIGSTEVWMSNGRPGLTFGYPLDRPTSLTPDQAAVFNIELTGTFGGTPGISPTIHISVNGGAFTPTALTSLGGNLYQTTIPATPCGGSVRYYITGVSTLAANNITVTDPIGAPAAYYTAPASSASSTLLAEDFEAAPAGWTVVAEGALTGGAWELGDPNGTWFEGFKASPEDDASPAGTNAYVTGLGTPGNALNAADVDGGTTHLVSPTFDLTDANATISFKRWFYSNTQTDTLTISVSNNDGGSWVPVTTVKPPPITNWNGHGEYQQTEWVAYSFNVSDFVTPTSQVKVRFSAVDVAPAGFVEAGIDDMTVLLLGCEIEPPVCASDVTGNGAVDIDDLLAVIGAWGGAGGAADVNNSGFVDIDDLLQVIGSWGPCK